MIRTAVMGLAAIVAAGVLSAARADSVVASDPDDIVTIIQNMGYKASLETDAEGDPNPRNRRNEPPQRPRRPVLGAPDEGGGAGRHLVGHSFTPRSPEGRMRMVIPAAARRMTSDMKLPT